MLHLIGEIGHWVFVVALLVVCVHATSVWWLLVQHMRLRRTALAEESRLLAMPMPADRELPDVLVQIPSFNEGALLGRIAEAISRLDWPIAKLHVQILDDSTDDSAAQARQAAEALERAGIDAILLHRTVRTGFKAGALAAGMAQSRQEFVAVLDADYVPRPDFLRACMRPMLLDPGLALVQARCDFINAGENSLTAVQQRMLDGHFAVEQATRSWLGLLLPFNGTCGVWRRAAIEEAGGWQGDTLAEDLDLSFRAQAKGWKARYLVTVTVPGELPSGFNAWEGQQHRWVKGFAQGARKLLPVVWRSGLDLRKKVAATFHLGGCVVGPVISAAVVGGVLDLVAGEGVTLLDGTLLALAVVGGVGSMAMMLLLGQSTARGTSILVELARLPQVLWVSHQLALTHLLGNFEAFLGRGSAFVRTPKQAARSEVPPEGG
jgi:cellulose synthase/poly-beta-1,6-N-acetylglucosamine synthase-like glycosyltransferase